MVDFKKYRERLENKIDEAKVADRVVEGPWEDIVIKDLNQMSKDFARDIGVESAHIANIDPKALIDKGTYKLPFEEWSHGRLTAINLILSYWLGFQSPTHELWDGLGLIQQAYIGGLNEFLQGKEGKEWLQGPKGEEWLQTPIGKEWKRQQQQAPI
ncbi:MAG: hypothetical protein ACRD8W_12350 [Nitrososphaeraceae archaeon]